MIINHCYQDAEMKILYDPLGEFQAKKGERISQTNLM